MSCLLVSALVSLEQILYFNCSATDQNIYLRSSLINLTKTDGYPLALLCCFLVSRQSLLLFHAPSEIQINNCIFPSFRKLQSHTELILLLSSGWQTEIKLVPLIGHCRSIHLNTDTKNSNLYPKRPFYFLRLHHSLSILLMQIVQIERTPSLLVTSRIASFPFPAILERRKASYLQSCSWGGGKITDLHEYLRVIYLLISMG